MVAMAVSGWRRWTCVALLSGALMVSLAGCSGGGGGGGQSGGGVADWQLRVTDLGTLGGDAGQALAVNDAGQVVGWSKLPSDTRHAFSYAGGAMTDLGTLPAGGHSEATDINDDGVICGTSDVGGNNQRAFRYANNQMEDIGAIAPWVNASADGINRAGQIVGNSGGAAYLWENGQMRQLPTPGDSAGAVAINRHGMVCGWCWLTTAAADHAFRGTRNSAVDIGLGHGTSSRALDINDSGHVVGFYTDGQQRKAFIFRNGTMHDIGTLGGNQGEAHGINNRGVVVGLDFAVTQTGHAVHAFVWDGTMHDLNDLLDQQSQGWTLARAFAISDNNLIVGHGRNPVGQYRPFLAQPH
jgi:probable HAF family extracellular repeat protein